MLSHSFLVKESTRVGALTRKAMCLQMPLRGAEATVSRQHPHVAPSSCRHLHPCPLGFFGAGACPDHECYRHEVSGHCAMAHPPKRLMGLDVCLSSFVPPWDNCLPEFPGGSQVGTAIGCMITHLFSTVSPLLWCVLGLPPRQTTCSGVLDSGPASEGTPTKTSGHWECDH